MQYCYYDLKIGKKKLKFQQKISGNLNFSNNTNDTIEGNTSSKLT